ncbi:Rossmann-like and DUF2520 domain-containing protein [Paludibacter sp.]|uniref:Rossmann-like and DUF2520 domain-containing protein n=1 Tax=Paludibacter sp. TaxID=1898105 RepID=UPI0013547D29|nr:Rossmann-like and DUF2520 domain-containing protein [Paludibacter sp.]MTK52099.1 DUF2520 domain-containing protein [Paludibacter sp.]
MKVVCIGSGNVATHLAKAIHEAGFTVSQIVSRTEENAKKLALSVNAEWTTSPDDIEEADIYIYSVSDSALCEIIRLNPHKEGLHVHTAGSMSLSLFADIKERGGVLYPLQTFSKGKAVDFKDIPLFIEASNANDLNILRELASAISNKVYEASSAQRQQLHLAAVFACNFTNHLFAIAESILHEADIPFEVLRPLIQETIDKTATLSPREGQTGPAVRKDFNVMNKHLDKLTDHPRWQEIYRLLSESIIDNH